MRMIRTRNRLKNRNINTTLSEREEPRRDNQDLSHKKMKLSAKRLHPGMTNPRAYRMNGHRFMVCGFRCIRRVILILIGYILRWMNSRQAASGRSGPAPSSYGDCPKILNLRNSQGDKRDGLERAGKISGTSGPGMIPYVQNLVKMINSGKI